MAWFAFDIDLYDADTMHLTAAQDGVYGRLLRFYYKTRLPLPDDDRALAAIGRVTGEEWAAMSEVIRAFFVKRRGRLHNKRADATLDREDALARKRSEKAKHAAEKRHGKSKPSMPQASSEHDNDMLGDATRPDQTRDKEGATTVAPKKTAKAPKKPLALDDEMLAWIADHCPGIDPAHELAKHLDWKASKGRTYRDDRAGFRTWCTNAQERINNRGGHGPARSTPLESLYRGAALALERREAQRQADCGAGDDPAQPLLDGSGGRASEGASNLRLVG